MEGGKVDVQTLVSDNHTLKINSPLTFEPNRILLLHPKLNITLGSNGSLTLNQSLSIPNLTLEQGGNLTLNTPSVSQAV
ncbi:MAG: hypothetical protein HC817_16210 [Saprospiraceae bacterium]|nr:hypothetical protein [Saprospiraceae bacterium]